MNDEDTVYLKLNKKEIAALQRFPWKVVSFTVLLAHLLIVRMDV
jgi:hypothetical protein